MTECGATARWPLAHLKQSRNATDRKKNSETKCIQPNGATNAKANNEKQIIMRITEWPSHGSISFRNTYTQKGCPPVQKERN